MARAAGKGAIIGAVTMVTNDVIPYGLVQGPRGQLHAPPPPRLKRKGVARSDITALRAAFQMLAQGEGTFQTRAQRLREDLVTEPAARERYQKGAPAVENGLFLVPKVIE